MEVVADLELDEEADEDRMELLMLDGRVTTTTLGVASGKVPGVGVGSSTLIFN